MGCYINTLLHYIIICITIIKASIIITINVIIIITINAIIIIAINAIMIGETDLQSVS